MSGFGSRKENGSANAASNFSATNPTLSTSNRKDIGEKMSKSLSIIGRGVCAIALSFAGFSVFVGTAGAVTAPPTPTLNSVSMNKDGTVTVNYTPGAANITAVTGYVVVAGSGGIAGTTVLASQSDPSLTSLTFTPTAAFASGTQLFVEAASATQGYSSASTGYAALTVPTANLTGLTITATSGATIVSWTNPSQTTALGALAVSGNEVAVTAKQVKTVVTVNGVTACTALLAATSCSFTNASAGLSDGGTYTFTAKTYNAVGGATLAATSADTLAAMVGTAPAAISGLTATVGLTAGGAPAVNLAFTAPATTGGGTLSYTVYDQNWNTFANTVCTSGVTCYVPINSSAGSLGGTVATPYNGVWIVKATNQAGLSTYATSGNTSADFAPSWSGVTFNTITATSAAGASTLLVKTSAVAAPTAKNPVQLYMAQLYTCTSSLSTTCTVSGSPVTVADPTVGTTFKTLTQGAYYYWTFTAYSGAGTSVIKGTVTQIPTTGGPSAPTGKASALSNSAYTVTWTAPTDNGGAAISGYSVQNYVLTSFAPSAVTAPTNAICTAVGGVYATSVNFCSTVTVTNTGMTVGMPINVYVNPTTTLSAAPSPTTWTNAATSLAPRTLTVVSSAGMSAGDTVSIGASDAGTIVSVVSATSITVAWSSGSTAIASGDAVVDTTALIKTSGKIIGLTSTTAATVDFGATAPSPAVTAANTGVVAAGGVKSPVAAGSPVATTGLTTTFTGLAQGNYYYAVITATNSLTSPVTTTTANATAKIVGPISVGVAPTIKSKTGSATAGTQTVTWYAGTAAVAAGISGYVLTDTTTGAVECNIAATSTTVYPATYSCSFSTAAVGKTDAFSLYAKDANGYNGAAATFSNVAATAPTKVTVFANLPAAGSYTLLWSDPSALGTPALNSYNVLAIGADGSRVTQNGVTRDSTNLIGTYTFVGLSPLTTWTFQVLSVQATGTSAYSSAAVAPTTAALSVPTVSSSLVVTHVSSTSIRFNWTDGTSGYTAASASTDTLTSVDYSLVFTGTLTDVRTGTQVTCTALTGAAGVANGCTFTGLTTSDTYTFAVVTNSLLGVSTTSLKTAVAQGATGASPAPTAVTATSSAAGTAVVVAWTPPTTNGGLASSSYTATAFAANDYAFGTPLGTPCSVAYGTNTCTITGLASAASYVILVVATNSAGSSKPGAATVTTNGVAGKPTGVTAVNGNGTITVSWTAPASNGGNAISSYTATATAGGSGGTTATCTTTATTCTITVTGTVGLATYTVGVVATNTAGNSSAGTPALGTSGATDKVMSPVTVPGAPASANFYGAAVGWTAPSSAGGSAITGYVIVASGSNGTQLTATTASTVKSYTFTNTTAGVTYAYSVAAKNALGQGAYLAATVASALPVQPTVGIETITATGSYALSWTGTLAADAQLLPVTYQIVATDSNGLVLPSVTTSNTFYSFGVLNPLLTYSFQIYAVTAYGLNPTSPLVPATVWSGATVSGAPTAVVQATVWSAGVDATTVSFGAPSNTGSTGAAQSGNNVALPVLYYSVSLVGADGTTGSCTAYSPAGCVVYGLAPNVAYTASITATNQVGSSAAGSGFFTVTPTAPGAPGAVTATQTYSGVTGAVTYTVSWTAAATGGLPISSYTATLFDNAADAIAAETSATPGAATGSLGSCNTGSGTVLTCTLTSSGATSPLTYILVTAFEGNTTDNHTASVPLSAPQIGLANAVASTGITVTPLSTGITVDAVNGNSGSLLVSWSANTDAVYGSPLTSNFSPITGYLVTAYDGSLTGNTVTCTAAAPATSCTLSGIYDNDAYTIVVEEINAATSANDAAAYRTATLDANTGGTTISETSVSFGSSTTTNWNTTDAAWIQSSATTGTTATITWTAPGAATYSAITGYTVTAQGPTGLPISCGTVAATATSCTFSGLTPNTAYTVSVTANSALGAGASSTLASVTTLKVTPPSAPTITGVLSTATGLAITWTAPATTGGYPVLGYVVTATDALSTQQYTCPVNSTYGIVLAPAVSCPINGLVVGNTYNISVQAATAAGIGAKATQSATYRGVNPEPVMATFLAVTAKQKSVSALSPAAKTALSGLISSTNDGAQITVTGYGTTKAIALARANAAANYLFNNGAAVHVTIQSVISKTVKTALVTVTSN